MKHLRLFVAAIVAVFGLSASAQTWTADEAGAGYYLLYNVGTGQYFTRGNGWGTQASLTEANPLAVEMQLVDGKYFIRTAINNANYGLEHLSGGTVYTDQSRGKQATWDFVQVGEDNGPVYNIVSADNHGGGAGAYLTGNTNTIIDPGTDGTVDNAKWKLLSLDKDATIIGMENATEDNPVDVTPLIKNASFSYNIIQPWTMVASNQNLFGGSIPANPCAESWRAAFTLSQTINVLNGKYQVTAQAALTEYDVTGQDMPVVYANEASAPFKPMVNGESSMTTMSDQFTAGNYVVGPIDVTVTDGKLTVGVKGTRTNTWCIWDNFQLKYLGGLTDLTPYIEALAAAVAEAEAVEGTVPAVAYQALAAVIAENNKEYETGDEYTAAINAIKDATVTAKALQNEYGRYNEIKAACLAINSELDTTAPDAQANAATSAEEIESAVAAVRAALLAYVSTVEEGEFDLTNAIIDNPSVRQNTNYWTAEGTPNGNYSWGVVDYEETEFYQQNFDFYQNLKGLPIGTYEFGVTGFHRAGNHATYFYAGEDKILIPGVESSVVNNMAGAKTYFDGGNGKVALKFALEGESNDIKIGIVNNDTQTDKWTIFRDFTLKYYGSKVDLTEYDNRWAEAVAAANAALEDEANAKVTGDELTAITAAKADVPEHTKASYIEKTDALLAATQAFIAAAPAYDAYAAEKAIAEMIGVTPGEEPANAAAAAAGVNALKVAEFNFVNENYKFDYAPVIGTFGEWTGTATVAGEPAEPNYLSNEHWSGQTHAYYEQDKNGYGNANGWTIKYEKTAKLPAGDYMLKVAARSSAGTTSLVSCTATENTVSLPSVGNTAKGIDLNGNAAFEGDNFAHNGLGFGWEWRYLPFTLTETTEVTMTFYAEATTQYQWMSIADATLLSKQEIQNIVEIAGTDEWAPEAQIATSVITDRKLLEGLNTVIFPFETTDAELGATTVLAYTGTTVEADGLTFNFQKVAPVDGVVTLQANTPYAVFVAADQTENLTFGTKNINPGGGWYNECVTDDPNDQFDFRGTYSEWKKGESPIGDKDYIAGKERFVKASGGNRLQAYRAYLQFVGTEEPANVAFNFGGFVVDGIEAVELLNNLSGNIYNLNGQKLQKAQKGINIVNGKKVLVK